MYSEHYVNNPETPHLSYLNNKAKQDVLDQDLQPLFGSPIFTANAHNNTAAEMIAMQKMSSTIFPTRTTPEERYRRKARNQKDIAITNHHKRYSNINQSPIKIEFFWGGAPLSAP